MAEWEGRASRMLDRMGPDAVLLATSILGTVDGECSYCAGAGEKVIPTKP